VVSDPDDHTLVGGQSWQELIQPELTVLPQPPLLDPQTARAVRAFCWAGAAAIWFGIAILSVVLAGLIVGIFGNPPVP
jgi:hypothetical protein